MLCLNCILISVFVKLVNCAMEPFILQGKPTGISNYPHSIFLGVTCGDSTICGGSILNQLVILTAGHCLEDCTRKREDEVHVNYGHEDRNRMRVTHMKDFVIHENYDSYLMDNDIALVLVKTPVALGSSVRRIAVMAARPSNVKLAHIAGWGVKNHKQDLSKVLLEGEQEIQTTQVCKKVFGVMPKGSFCAGPLNGPGAPEIGDSGSGLIVQGYIQIGLVSFKRPSSSFSLVAYTDVPYHYSWIRKNSVAIVCKRNKLG